MSDDKIREAARRLVAGERVDAPIEPQAVIEDDVPPKFLYVLGSNDVDVRMWMGITIVLALLTLCEAVLGFLGAPAIWIVNYALAAAVIAAVGWLIVGYRVWVHKRAYWETH